MRWVALLALAVAVILLVFTFLPADVRESILPRGQTEYDKGVQNFGARNAQEFISFSDPEYKFRVSYPIGFMANFVNSSEERFHAAAFVQDSAAMVFSVAVSNQSAQSVYDGTLSDLPFTVLSKGTVKVNGKDALFIDGFLDEEVTTERLYVKQMVLQCGGYSLVATGVIPSFLTEERITFDYMFTTLECP